MRILKRDSKFISKCCNEWLIYRGDKIYVCPECGLIYKEIMSWWDKYNTILVEDKENVDKYIPSDDKIIDEYVEKELTKELQTELWKKLNRNSIVSILKNKGYRYKYINREANEGWSNLYIYKRVSNG